MSEANDKNAALEELLAKCREAIEAVCPDVVEDTELSHGQIALRVRAESIEDVCRALREAPELEFDFLCDITAVDWLMKGREPRFDVVYNLWSIPRRRRVRLKCGLAENALEIDSICEVWSGADWHERETYDMFGIVFRGHPDLRRILMPEGWEGYPLRKDFPAGGTKSFYFKRDTHPHAGEPEDLVPRIRVQTSDI